MKLMIASDIHGSAQWCRALTDRLEAEKPEKLILLGDYLYHGPRNDLPDGYDPKAVIELLNGIAGKLLCVRGNCDAEVDQMVLNFPIMADSAMFYADGRSLYCTHGHLLTEKDFARLGKDGILLQGHTHVPLCDRSKGVLHLNPGSVSIPKEGSPHSYLTLEDGLLEWKALPDGAVWKTERV